MQNWKFKISGQLLVPGMENTVLNIYPENFKTFNRISDYINKKDLTDKVPYPQNAFSRKDRF